MKGLFIPGRFAAASVCGLAGAALAVGPTAALASGAHHVRAEQKLSQRLTKAASSQASPAESADASYSSGPLQVQFDAQRAAGAAPTAATGTFSATMGIGALSLMTLSGPVTCLDVEGSHVGLFYPVTGVTPTIEGTVLKGVYVYAQTGRYGQPLSFSFLPSTTATATSCAPLPGAIPITGGYLSLSS